MPSFGTIYIGKPICFLFVVVLIMFSAVVKSFRAVAPLGNKVLINRSLGANYQRFDYFRSGSGGRDFDRGRGGGRGRDFGRGGGGGGGRSGRHSDPFAELTFSRTIKIDPELKTPVQDMKMSDITTDILLKKGFTEMTPVQSQSYHDVLNGKDVVARSRTGTGKTFAFGLPLIEKLVQNNANSARPRELPVILILEPTRELAMQVAQELGSVLRPHRLRIAPIYGGVSFSQQQSVIKDGVHIIVGTPGRILDHISRGTVDFSNVKHVVLDEGDTMLEMGFQKAVETILMSVKAPGEEARKLATQSLSSFSNEEEEEFDHHEEEFLEGVKGGKASGRANDVQMLLFSATMPAWICKLTDKLMRNPIFLDAVQEGETRLASTITHYAIPLPMTAQGSGPGGRVQAVSGVLEDIIMTKGKGGQSIVFANFKDDCDILVSSKAFNRLRATTLHGDISQQQRSETLRAFKEKRIDVLVATDVAARGLDIAGVDLVVHTALPNDADSYVHRSGRTGRAGRDGTAVVLYTPDEIYKMENFQRNLMFKFEHIGLPDIKDVIRNYVDISEDRVRHVSSELASHFLPYARKLIERAQAGQLAVRDEDVDVVDSSDEVGTAEDKPVKGVPLETDEIVARLLAAMSNRKSFSSRSMLTGEEDKTTLQIRITPRSSAPPSNVPDFQKIIGNFLSKKLEITEFRFRKTMIGELHRSDVRGDEDRTVFLQDFDSDIAEQILTKMADITIAGLTIERCQKLPRALNNNDRHYGGGGGGGRGGGDRRGGDRRGGGGDRRGGERSSSRDSYEPRGGRVVFDRDNRRGGNDYEQDSRGSRGGGGDRDRRSWQSSR